jgi:hypothetical protein
VVTASMIITGATSVSYSGIISGDDKLLSLYMDEG